MFNILSEKRKVSEIKILQNGGRTYVLDQLLCLAYCLIATITHFKIEMENTAILLIVLLGIQGRLVTGGLPRSTVTDSPSDTAYLEADQFQTSYGYYPSSGLFPAQTRNLSLRKHFDTKRTKALRSIQKFYHILQSGELDKETTQRSPRFGNADTVPKLSTKETPEVLEMKEGTNVIQTKKGAKNHDRKDSGIKADRRRHLDMSRKPRVKRDIFLSPDGSTNHWEFEKMRWKITRPSKQRPLRAQRTILKMAMALWENLVPVKFVEETRTSEAHMHIVFHSFASTKFDDKMHRNALWLGQNETINDLPNSTGSSSGQAERDSKQKRRSYSIAHARIPKTSYRYSLRRDIHFDEDHTWSKKELFSVALHEIGHALGLADSSGDETSVMFEFNRGNTAFSPDDITAVFYRYGYRMKSDNPYVCTSMVNGVDYVFKALLYPRAQIYYFILGIHIKLHSERYSISPPVLGILKAVFQDSPSEFDVIFSDQARKTVFIINGAQLYQYRGAVVFKMKRRYFVRMFFPETPKFAVTVDSPAGEYTILFGYKYWWIFEFDGKHVLKTKPNHRFTARISELLKSAKFAVRWTDGEVYVVMRNNSYFTLEFNISNKTSVSPLKRGKPAWMVHVLCRNNATSVSEPTSASGFSRCRMSVPIFVIFVMLRLIKFYLHSLLHD